MTGGASGASRAAGYFQGFHSRSLCLRPAIPCEVANAPFGLHAGGLPGRAVALVGPLPALATHEGAPRRFGGVQVSLSTASRDA